MGDEDPDDMEYEIEAILKKRTLKKNMVEYLIKWKGFDDSGDNTWEPKDNIEKDLLIAFERSLLEEVKRKKLIKSVSKKEAEEETTEEQEEYEIETILDKKSMKHGKVEYLIKWKGYDDPEDRTWEPASGIPNDI